MKPIFFLLVFALIAGVFRAQTTIGNDTSKTPLVKKPSTAKHKVLLIPFDNKMYMSEIDHVINAETKQNQNEIRWGFKDGIDEQLHKKLKSKYEVVSLMEDTAKNKKDLAMIYSGIGYKYDKVPSQKITKRRPAITSRVVRFPKGKLSMR
jgi:hypothetical protein